MRKPAKKFLAVLCALALVAGTAAAASVITTRTIEAQFMGIQTVVNGSPVTLTGAGGKTLEPFLYNGDAYVPARAVGEAMGKTVTFDNATKTLTIGKIPLAEDADQLIATVEGAHPAFALDQIPAGYQAAKDALLAVAANPAATESEFFWAAMAYTSALSDGHTQMDVSSALDLAQLDLQWVADGEKLLLLDQNGNVTGQEVTQIGGVAVKDVFAAVDQYIASENQSGRDLHHATWSRMGQLLLKVGVKCGYNTTEITIRDGGKETTRTVGFVYAQGGALPPVITAETMGDVFYIDFNQCVVGDEVTAVAERLAEAVKAGTTKVIIDVRGNGGGNSMACEQLLAAMGMAAPEYGVYVRFSPLAQAQREYPQSSGSETYAPHPEQAKANDAIDLVVLTDENTYSSATMLGVFVQDGKLGTIIGRASSNAPNSYGDILSFQLNNTRFGGYVSHKQWLRPDVNADPDVLRPDLETAVGEDSLQAALAFLAN